jgi:hypothetical protein
MGFFTKANPKSTWKTVVRHGVMTGLIGTCLYTVILWWNGWWDDWPVKMGICATLMLLIGGLWEWQAPNEG